MSLNINNDVMEKYILDKIKNHTGKTLEWEFVLYFGSALKVMLENEKIERLYLSVPTFCELGDNEDEISVKCGVFSYDKICEHIKFLALENLSIVQPDIFTKFPRLHTLVLSKVALQNNTNFTIPSYVTSFTSIEVEIENLIPHKNLKLLNIDTDVRNINLTNIDKFEKLEQLYIYDNFLELFIDNIEILNSFTKVSLGINGDTIQYNLLSKLPQLVDLMISDETLRMRDIKTISKLRSLTSLDIMIEKTQRLNCKDIINKLFENKNLTSLGIHSVDVKQNIDITSFNSNIRRLDLDLTGKLRFWNNLPSLTDFETKMKTEFCDIKYHSKIIKLDSDLSKKEKNDRCIFECDCLNKDIVRYILTDFL
jgi:hypothetical protein